MVHWRGTGIAGAQPIWFGEWVDVDQSPLSVCQVNACLVTGLI
jgi:hypothetical protein